MNRHPASPGIGASGAAWPDDANMPRPTFGTGCCVTLAIACLSGCQPPDHSYFPLHDGASWEYRLSQAWNDGERSVLYAVKNHRAKLPDGRTVTIRRNDRGTDYYIEENRLGIARVAKRTVVESVPRPDPEPRYVLKFPLRPGTEWRVNSHPYLLKRLLPYRERFNRDLGLVMHYSVVSDSAEVSVPAGRFTDCLLVRGEGTLRIYADAVAGVSEVPVSSLEWYAPGVGLVKLERLEELDTTQIIGGTARLELVRYHP